MYTKADDVPIAVQPVSYYDDFVRRQAGSSGADDYVNFTLDHTHDKNAVLLTRIATR